MSDLRKIPGVGARIEQAIQAIGIRCIADLVGRDPEELYCLDCRMSTVLPSIMLSIRCRIRKN